MKQKIIIFLFMSFLVNSLSGQTRDNYSDDLLTSSFKIFQTSDFELANHILPFLRERFIKELEDTSSFTNSYDSLSNYIGIKYSSDSLLKTYCWSERSGGCCHTSATFAQFITTSGKINYVDLEEPEGDGDEIFITDLQMIEIYNQPFYLILGWGTCCGGKHYEVAKIYKIKNEALVLVDSAFADESVLCIEANRSQKIELKYSPEAKTLSYNRYLFDENTGFYKKEKSVVKWKLEQSGFKRKN